MKKLLSLFFTISLTLSACGTASTQPAPPAQTGTPTVTPTATQTPTSTITPLPTIPTFTPTFDVSSIVTVTPAEKAECPKTDPYPDSNFNLYDFKETSKSINIERAVLQFLNKYDPLPLIEFVQHDTYSTKEHVDYEDLTNDGSPELTLGLITGNFYIFGCKNGEYKTLLSLPSSDGYNHSASILSIADNNLNNIPELTLLAGTMSQGGHYYLIYEWNGEKFRNIVLPLETHFPSDNDLWVEVTGKIYYTNIDNDKLIELVLNSGIPVWETYTSGLPWRNKTTYYKWDGEYFAPLRSEFTEPEFRFQAIQDGDLAFSQSEFFKAQKLYQETISNPKLKSISVNIRLNLQEAWHAKDQNKPLPTPYPEDLTEFPSLAAYAYYRIILLHLVQAQEAEAASTYQTLQDTFGSDQYAAPYVEMATAFWEAYQSTQKMYDGCTAAIQYAVEYPEILIPLGSDYHGWQSHTYVAADICPFR